MLVALLASSLLACTTQTTVAGPSAVAGLQGVETSHGTFRFTGQNGTSVQVRPEDTLTVRTVDGNVRVAKAERMCRNGTGLYLRERDEPCNQASRIATWDEIGSIEVKQFDGGGTVAVVTFAAAVTAAVVVAVVLVASESKGKSSSGGNGPKLLPGGTRTPARPSVKGNAPPPVLSSADAPRVHSGLTGFRGGPSGARGSGAGRSPDARSRTLATGDTHPPAIAREHRSRHWDREPSSLTVGILNTGDPDEEHYAPAPVGSDPAPIDSAPGIASGPLVLDLEPRGNTAPDASPLFSGLAVRRSSFRPSLRIDGGACVASDACFAGAARLGFTVANLVELSGGVRWEEGTSGSLFGTFGAGLHGQFPGAQALALFLGTQVAVGDGFRVAPSAGLRVRPAAEFWIGLQPAGVTYFSKEKRFAYTPSIELAYEF